MEDNEYSSSAIARNVLCKRSTPGTCVYLTKLSCVWFARFGLFLGRIQTDFSFDYYAGGRHAFFSSDSTRTVFIHCFPFREES